MASYEDDIELQIASANRIRSLYDNCKKEPIANRTKSFLLTKRNSIDEQWLEFKNRHDVIFKAVPRSDRAKNSYIASETYNEVLKIRERMHMRLEEWTQLIAAGEPQQAPVEHYMQPAAPRQRLPAIKIEPFSGDYAKWMAFKSIFISLIHSRADVPPIEKFHYLLSFLTGEAARVVSHYALTEENYVSAWDELLGRYDNERAVVDSLIMQLIGIPAILKESGAKLRELLNVAKECVNSLHNWKINTSTWDPILIVILVSKLDSESRRLWEASLASPKKLQTLNSLYTFLDNRFLALENQQKHLPAEFFQNKSTNSSSGTNNNYVNPFNRSNKQLRSHQTFLAQTNNCDFCKGQHVFKACPEFISADPKKKGSMIRRLNRCANCLGKHNVSKCTSQTNCGKCHKRHNVLLHFNNNVTATKYTATPAANSSSSNPVAALYTGGVQAQVQVLLATALVRTYSANGSPCTLRCLVDPGSQSSFITTEASQFLGLKRDSVIAPITGLGAVSAETATSVTDFKIFSLHCAEFQLSIQALVISSITGHLPTSKLPNSRWQHIIGLQLADPTYYRAGKVDVLLGADAVPHIMLDGLLHGKSGEPMAQNTALGWILTGQVSSASKSSTIVSCHTQSFHLRSEFDAQLERFWELEELPAKRPWTAEEIDCEQAFVKNHTRDLTTGRYSVALPFKKDSKPLGKSRFQALSRLYQLEKKLQKKEIYGKQYREVINEYVAMDHMEHISNNKEVIDGYFLPHHAVIKESSSTTKLRVVFDASAKTSSGESLNDQLLVGPTIQEDLLSILVRWRKHRIAMSADVEKMYRQIRVQENDTYFQKMLWRNNENENVKEYRLLTLTFGTASAAYLAIRTLRQLAVDEADSYTDASKVVLRDFYVDDLLTGADTEEAAVDIQRQLTKMLSAGGFKLRKWISNSAMVLSVVPEADREVQLPLSIDMSDTTKTLGIHYHPSTDCFQFKISLEFSVKPPTKRSLLSESARLFDPLGWLAPVVIRAKIMFQQLWKKKMSWDQKLDEALKDNWLAYRASLIELESIVIPRWIGWTGNSQRTELHVFCDASESAYAAVIYARVIDSFGDVRTTLLTAKTKVAPIKSVSLPRLELCGAVLAARLLQRMKESMCLEDVNTYAWTDSTIVLAWLGGHPSKWKSFVANRVSEIQGIIERKRWQHIRSEDNPADCASRGISPSSLKLHPLWWSGPPWFKSTNDHWPEGVQSFDTEIDAKGSCLAMVVVKGADASILENISSLKRLLRVVGACLRFAYNCKHKHNRRSGPLTVVELADAQRACDRLAQAIAFPEEVARLTKNLPITEKSAIQNLTPYCDDNGLMRIGGRVDRSNLSHQRKHQYILSPKGNFTKLLIEEAHIRAQHGGTQLVMNILRSRYWIVGTRNAVKSVIRRCVICHRYQKSSHDQLMGSIPKVRITEAPPFKSVAIDYAGPITLKASKLRTNKTHKAWIALFVCMCTKAVHIELVTELTTNAYLAAFTRFTARRGLPTDIYSDNAKNFVGAGAALTREFNRMLEDTTIPNKLSGLGIQWHFIPPRSPHFGGLWEAGIKAMKKHLHRVLGTTVLTFEEMTTVLTSIEATLNSRPLTPLTEDIDDLTALTPGHFLIGRELVATPSEDFSDTASNRLTKWKLLKKIQQDFWKRWRVEYLCGLQQRNKWASTKKDIKVGNMVLLKEDNVPPSHWTLCRVVIIHPGTDGHVRVVTLKTPTGHLKRAITKLCPLPIED